jgi:predicted metal-dependent hydrolase
MSKYFVLGDVRVHTVFKAVKNVHLTVHPPKGRVTLVAPTGTRPDVARAYAISKLNWIRQQQRSYQEQARETPRRFIERESHHVWGRRYLLCVVEQDRRARVEWGNRTLTLYVRPGASALKRAEVMSDWYKHLLHKELPPLIATWEHRLGVKVEAYYLQRMKTKWGSCNHVARNIRLNTELAKKPKDLLEYVVVHEMVHLIEPTHSERFINILNRAYPSWREARAELNELPLSSEKWNE